MMSMKSYLLDANANRNVADVVNYIKATEYAINRLKTLPLCNRLIKETHAVLMEGVRGQKKVPVNSDTRKTGLAVREAL
jgi:Fic family protein